MTTETPSTTITQPSSDTTISPPDLSSLRLSPSNPPTQNTLTSTILARHSTRIFHSHLPVPQTIIEECLTLAQHAPSSTNIQPWRLTITSGPKLERLRDSMVSAVQAGQRSTVPPIPDKYRPYRSAVGKALYGPNGYNIPREDVQATEKARLRNYEFFGAPMVAVIGIDESLIQGGADVMSVGLYVQTLVLLLTERGLGTCLEVSTSGYGDVLKRELGIPKEIVVLSTLAIGYEDTSHHMNTYKMPRDEWKDHVDFVVD